jgi:hypothetical protein
MDSARTAFGREYTGRTAPVTRVLSSKSMDLSFLTPVPKLSEWVPAEIAFMGAENYELGKTLGEVKLVMIGGGFQTQFRRPIAMGTDELLGTKYEVVTIRDIEIRLPALVLSVATMDPSSFPRTFRRGETVGLNG